MKVTNKIDIHLDDLRHIPPINVMQADAYTRVLEFSLYSGGVAWNVPEGVDVAVAYIGSSGKGIYDTLPDGTAACDVNGNVVTAVVAPQAVAMDGNTNLNIIFTDDAGHQLAAFCVTLKVERNPAVNATKPPDYINLRQWMTAELANLVWDYAVNVYADQAGDGYVSERSYDAILREYESGRAVYCALEISDQERLQLPFVKIDGGVLYFSAVCAGKEYLVTITADGVTVEISECGGGNSGGNVDLTGVVKSVNGNTPDENGNVNVIGGEAPENAAFLEDVTMDEASGDFIPMLSENGTEYRLSIGNDGIPVIKNLDGRVVWNGTSGGSSGGNTGGDTGGDSGDDNDDPIDNTEWVSGAEIAYTVIADEYPDKNDGSIKPDTSGGYDRTDYIYCYGAGMLWSTGGSAYNAWYDSAKQFISSFDTTYEGYRKVPENAVYMVCSAATLDNFKCKLYKKVEPTWTDGVAYQFTLVENEYVTQKGVDTAYDGWKRTDFVNCVGVSKLGRTDGGGDITYACFYNAEKEFITAFAYMNGATEFNVPVGACYFKVSATNAIMDALVIVPHA